MKGGSIILSINLVKSLWLYLFFIAQYFEDFSDSKGWLFHHVEDAQGSQTSPGMGKHKRLMVHPPHNGT